MKGKLLGIPLIILLLLGSVFSFSNDSLIEDWLKNNTIVTDSDEVEILSVQEEERWLVLTVDFRDTTMDQTEIISEATAILTPEAYDYFFELSSGTVSVEVEVHDQTIIASEELAFYGTDYGVERDSSPDGSHLPMILAEEVITASRNDIDWSRYDLDDNKKVDRLLVLHTSVGQESGGNSNRIWSHFTTFQEPIDLPNGYVAEHYAMASLGSGVEGFGTAMHEMMHQMGAYDLYPSDGQQTSIWKGVGDWDIMASGNWNDDGKTPALPMSSTLETIGLNSYQILDFDWVNYDGYCQAQTINYQPSEDFLPDYKIEIDQGEYVWIEYRGGNAFDAELPGNGVLVSYQDTTIDGFDDNELNINNKRPYLKIIEADGNNNLLSGSNQGQASDLFANGSSFGSQGIEIRNHDGVLVDWYAQVTIDNDVEIVFKSDSCVSDFTVDLPDHAITNLLNEPISIIAESTVGCSIDNNLASTDGRLVTITPTVIIANQPTVLEISFNSAAQHNTKTRLFGYLVCSGEARNLDIELLSLSIIPQNSQYNSNVPVVSLSTVTIPINSVGTGSHVFSYKIDGPLSRIADSQQTLTVTGDADFLVLDIDPKGLLTNNMIVNGAVELMDSNGNQWTITVTLTAESGPSNSIRDYINPGQLIGLALLFGALWVYLTMKESETKTSDSSPEVTRDLDTTTEHTHLDAWGRMLDD